MSAPPSEAASSAQPSSSAAALEAPTEAPTEAHFGVLLEKMAAYVEGEAEISLEDYRLLRAMNLAAAERYSGMAESSADLVAFAERLQSKCETMLPQLSQVRDEPSPSPLARARECASACVFVCVRLTCSRLKSPSSREQSNSSTATRSAWRANSPRCKDREVVLWSLSVNGNELFI